MTATTNLSAALKTIDAAVEHNETPSDGLYVELHNADGSIACKSTLSEFLASAAKAILSTNTLSTATKIAAVDGNTFGGIDGNNLATLMAGKWTQIYLNAGSTYYPISKGIYLMHELANGEYHIFIASSPINFSSNQMFGAGSYIRYREQDDNNNYGMVILPGTREDERLRISAHMNIQLQFRLLAV